MRSKIWSKLIFASCVWHSDRAYYWVRVLIKQDIGRRFPLQLQCSLYQGQQGDVSQSVRGNCKVRFFLGYTKYIQGSPSGYDGWLEIPVCVACRKGGAGLLLKLKEKQ